ncbi:hypothetical protein BC826DRAFT_1108482 [Russula brevipes]|nr:hypothetical protein BC826DRAFT_1108482 [Russula brevipes]
MTRSPLLCVGVHLLEPPQRVSGLGLVLEAKLREMLLERKTEGRPQWPNSPSIVTRFVLLLYTIPD